MIGGMIGDRYRVIRKLGEGGMAIVYLAVDEKLGRNVAVKVLREKFQAHQEIRTRFQHEARAISAFDHSNILKVYDYSGANSAQLWIVTELIHGRNLGQIVETAPGGWLHPVIASCIVREICKALSLAHSEGIVHRDVKPDNVMLTQHGIIKLMDFGIAKIRQNNSMTQTGMFMGSPSYMSPEQVRGRDIDHRSDIYSLGILFYELVTGKLPFSGQSTADVAMKILSGQYAHPKFLKDQLPIELNDLIVSMMSIDPAHRPQSVDTVGNIVDKFLERNGFESSNAELDRCFRDPKSYGERLAKLVQQTAMVALPTQIIQPQSRMDAATRLPIHEQKTQLLVQAHNEAAIDRPIAFVPSKSASQTINEKAPHPAHAVPPPPMRRDHALPRNAVPHLSRKASGSSELMAHLPERRLQQRPDQTIVKHAPAKSQHHQPSQKKPPALQPQFKKPSVPQVQRREQPRQPRPPRSLPRVPNRNVRHYVVHREVSVANDSWSGWLTLIILLAIGFIGYTLFADRLHFGVPTSPTSVTKVKTYRPKPAPEVAKTAAKVAKIDEKTKKIELPAPPAERVPAGKSIFPVERRPDPTQERKATPTPQPTHKPKASQPVATPSFEAKVVVKPTPAALATTPDDKDDNDELAPTPTPRAQKSPEIKPTPAPSGKATIAISSNPAAEVYINGRRMGTTNDAGTSSDWYDLPSGRLKIELRRTGFASRTEFITVNGGEKKRFGPYPLTKEGTKAQPTSYRLTLSTNVTPTQVTLLNYESRSTKTFVLNSNSQTITLERGVYEVTLLHAGESRKRRIEMTGSETQLTFSAEFKEGSH